MAQCHCKRRQSLPVLRSPDVPSSGSRQSERRHRALPVFPRSINQAIKPVIGQERKKRKSQNSLGREAIGCRQHVISLFWPFILFCIWCRPNVIAGFDPRPWEEQAPSFTDPTADEWRAALTQARDLVLSPVNHNLHPSSISMI